ncbi:MAG: protein translocase subunit SecF [Rhodospirillaceae bacterium]|nr:protein translocase subunit SecF [Rhodospirillaceae bacterium]
MFHGIKFLPDGTHIDFVGKRFLAMAFSFALLLGAGSLLMTKGLNYGIDFSGGIQMEVRADQKVDLSELRTKLNALGVGDIELQGIGETGREVMIRIPAFETEKAQNIALKTVRDALGPSFEDRQTGVVGPKVGEELIRDGVLAVALAILAIAAYIWLRFEWHFALGGMVALIHDVLATMGVFSLTGMEFSLTSVAAVLTIAGYSINDTVVVYDRVRENLRKYKKMPLADLLNLSLNEVFSRTVLTSLTTIMSVVAIAIFGGDVLRGFALALIWGVGIGTYSSIYIALPILIYFKLRNADVLDAPEAETERP